MQVKTIRVLSVFTLVAAAVSWSGCMLSGQEVFGFRDVESRPLIYFAAGYVLTLAAFAACPKTRRTDLAKLALLGGALICVMRAAIFHVNFIFPIGCEAAGTLAALTPTLMERVRAALRGHPDAQFSMRRSSERRTAKPRFTSPVLGQAVAVHAGARVARPTARTVRPLAEA